MKKTVSIALKVLVCILAVGLLFWFQLPPINLRSQAFWSFLFESIVLCSAIVGISAILGFFRGRVTVSKNGVSMISGTGRPSLKNAALSVKIVLGVLGAIIVFSLGASAVGARLFNASRYANLIQPQDGSFAEDVAELSMSQIPVVDRDSASRLGQRKLGEMSDLVSQFVIEADYTQINFGGKPVRVTPLGYADFIKWCTNSDEGIPAYIMVDLTTQEVQLTRLSELGLDNIKYARSEYLMRDLNRKLRFDHPTKIFGEISFEIDENGTPYWVASVIRYRIGLWNGADIGGVVLLNAVTGESQYYDLADVPTWVDQAYDESMLMEQLTDNGTLKNGFWNSVFGQKGCVMPTEGYNYIAIDDDVWMYTGITSVTADESNIGFVLVNLRTKEARYYEQAGAEEYSAMSSAQGQIQEKNYTATFPVLLNVGGRPTYFMSLKDSAGLVKMYAYVDMAQYQIVGTGATVDKARDAYIALLEDEDIGTETETPEETKTVAGTVSALASAVVDGNTRYYVRLNEDAAIHVLTASLSDALPFLKEGDTITITYTGDTITAVTIG